jgi:hypothetical protein
MPSGPNPHMETCPDFEQDKDYSAIIEALVSAGKTREEAVALQVELWQCQHDCRTQAWDQTTAAEEEAERARARSRLEEEEEARRQAEAQQEADRKERDKKILKLGILVPNQVLTRTNMATTPQATLEKLRRRIYIPLYKFTIEGRAKSRNALYSTERSITFDEADDGRLVIAPRHLTRSSKATVLDEDLTWEQFIDAKSSYISALTESNWPEDFVGAYITYFLGIETHPARDTKLGKRALLLYQARMQKLWHEHLTNETVPDISAFNNNFFQICQSNVNTKHQTETLEATVHTLKCLQP